MAVFQGVAQVKFMEVATSARGVLPNFLCDIPALWHQHFLQHGEGTSWLEQCQWHQGSCVLKGHRATGDAKLRVVLHCASPPAPQLERRPWISFLKTLMQANLRVITWISALSIGVNCPSQQPSERAHHMIL